jgi:hypothetical protein
MALKAPMSDEEHDHDDDETHEAMDATTILEALQSAIDRGEKVTLERRELSADAWCGLPLMMSDDFVLLRALRDFYFDGFVVVRLRDITAVRSGEMERFMERVMRAEGFFDNLRPPKPLLLRSWRTVLEGVRAHYRFAIVECENASDDGFYLGEIAEVDDDQMALFYIQANGVRDVVRTEIPLDEVTVVRFDDPYVNLFGKYSVAEDQH